MFNTQKYKIMRYCLTMVYEVRSSSKGWSEPTAFFFSESAAKRYAEYCNYFAAEHDTKIRYRVVARAMSDCIFTDVDPE